MLLFRNRPALAPELLHDALHVVRDRERGNSPEPRALVGADVEDLVADVGYRPNTSVEVGVRNFVDWYFDYYRVNR